MHQEIFTGSQLNEAVFHSKPPQPLHNYDVKV